VGLERVPARTRADVCIVGAGAAGLTLAHALRDSGLAVLILESGPVEHPADLDSGEVVGHAYNGLLRGRVRGVGGTTAVWPGQSMRMRPGDFAGLPFGADALDPYYRRAEELLGIPPGETAADPWRLFGEQGPGFDPENVESGVAIFAKRKNLAELDFGGATLVTGAVATRVERGRIEVRDLHGHTTEVEADAVVVAAGGIETPRLLLASGTGGDAVGRGFQDHAFCEPARVVGEARALQNMYGMRLLKGLRYYPKLLLSSRLRPGGEPGCMANVVFRYRARSSIEALLRVRRARRSRTLPRVRDLGYVALGLPELAAGAVRVLRGREPAPKPAQVRVLAIAEQMPRSESRITLADELDPLGVPRARIEWRLGEEERRSIETFLTVLDEELRRTRAGSLEVEPWIADETWAEHAFDSFHPSGGAPFGPVLNDNGQVRGSDGLYVCGSSSFPRAGCVNPTLTIMALAFRLADHLLA
jgi:choline dehydrogenase-like flavoprotein